MRPPKVIVFTCNWNAYSGLETAGVKRLTYPPNIHPLRVVCLGQISPGIILKAFEKGADGVLLLGCPPGECHYEFGNRRAEEIVDQTRQLAALLGYHDEQINLSWVAAGNGEGFVDIVQWFANGLGEKQ